MSTRTHIAVPLVSSDTPLPQQVAAAQAAGADFVELRVDLIGDVDAVAALLDQPHPLPYILTVRAREEGGAWHGTDAERVALIEQLGLKLPGYIDVEYSTWQRSANLRQKIGLVCNLDNSTPVSTSRPKNKLIISHHDSRSVPADLDALCNTLAQTPAHVIKLVATPQDTTDALRLADLLRRRAPQRPTVVLGMGDAGLLTRVVARKLAAFLTFATLTVGEESAPGQPTIDTLRDVYHWNNIGSATPILGVVGWPVSHSQSPRIHNHAMRTSGIDGVYLPLPVRPAYADFSAFMKTVNAYPHLHITGLSVTIPHKENALRWLAENDCPSSAVAERCGAVNTLIRDARAGWRGDNTDVVGIQQALGTIPELRAQRLSGLSAAVLGAGGVARAAIVALQEAGCQSITVYNRNPDRAAHLAQEFGTTHRAWEDRVSHDADLIVNCTSVGMYPHVAASPLPDTALRPNQVVFDTIYRPEQTTLLRTARLRGATVIGGSAMFIGQAEAQFTQWHHQPPWADSFRNTLQSLLHAHN